MSPISRIAEAILADMAADQGIEALSPDETGVIPIEIGDVVVALAFSEALEVAYLMNVIEPEPAGLPDWPWIGFSATLKLTGRPTRLALEASSGALVLITQIALTGIRYAQFSAAMEQFLDDVRAVRSDLAEPAPAGKTVLDQAVLEDHFVFRI